MSLLSHLNDARSPVRHFLSTEFPLTREFAQKHNKLFCSTPTVRPNGETAGYAFHTIGTALDYRLRYFYRVTPHQKLVAHLGAQHGVLLGSFHPDLIDDFFRSLSHFLKELDPAGKNIPNRAERQLAKYCVILALFEQIYRGGYDVLLSRSAPLSALPPSAVKTSDLLKLVKTQWIDDLVSLVEVFHSSSLTTGYRRLRLNPTFAGSRDVGGADADLIVDGCLLEIKSSIRPAISRQILYQLLGYTLLDYENKYKLREVGVYWARQGVVMKWRLTDVIAQLSGAACPPLQTIRNRFKSATKKRRLRIKKHG